MHVGPKGSAPLFLAFYVCFFYLIFGSCFIVSVPHLSYPKCDLAELVLRGDAWHGVAAFRPPESAVDPELDTASYGVSDSPNARVEPTYPRQTPLSETPHTFLVGAFTAVDVWTHVAERRATARLQLGRGRRYLIFDLIKRYRACTESRFLGRRTTSAHVVRARVPGTRRSPKDVR